MITNASIDQTLLQLLLDHGAWEERGLKLNELMRLWPQTGLRVSDFSESLVRTAEHGWTQLAEYSADHIEVRFTSVGFDLATVTTATHVRADRGVGTLLSSLGMKFGIHLLSQEQPQIDRRHGRATRH